MIRQRPANGTRPEEGLVPLVDGDTWAYLATASRAQGELKVTPVKRQFAPPAMQHAVPANLGGKAALLGYDLEAQGGGGPCTGSPRRPWTGRTRCSST